MKDHHRLTPALTFLAALSAVALPPASGQAAPSAALSVEVPQRPSDVLDVADQQQPRRSATRSGSRRGGDAGDGQADQLNDMSLRRARQGQNSPTPGPDSTSNLNDMSERNAGRGRNMGGQAPMPFR